MQPFLMLTNTEPLSFVLSPCDRTKKESLDSWVMDTRDYRSCLPLVPSPVCPFSPELSLYLLRRALRFPRAFFFDRPLLIIRPAGAQRYRPFPQLPVLYRRPYKVSSNVRLEFRWILSSGVFQSDELRFLIDLETHSKCAHPLMKRASRNWDFPKRYDSSQDDPIRRDDVPDDVFLADGNSR